MAETITMAVAKREETGRKVRNVAGRRIPAVIYGHGVDPQNVWVDEATFLKTYEAAGENTIVKLEGDAGKDVNILIHDIQSDPVAHTIIHADLFQVNMNETVDADIPVVFVGESAAVKTLGGTLTHMVHVTVRALPLDLPHEIEINISSLETFDDTIAVATLSLGDKVEVLTAEDQTIASVSAPRTQEELDAIDEEVDADVSQVEGVGEEGAEGEEAAEGAEAPAEGGAEKKEGE